MKCHKLSFYVCHETIYQFVYQSKNKELYHCLPYRKPKRLKRYSRPKSLCRYGEIGLITERPENIVTRKRFGHWEGDTIQFKGAKEKVVTTLVERKSRLVFLIKNNRKHSYGVMDKIKEKFEKLPSKMCKTITFDQGSEFADYRHLEQQIKCKVYYCQTHLCGNELEGAFNEANSLVHDMSQSLETTPHEIQQLCDVLNELAVKDYAYPAPDPSPHFN
jgi:IS30 family transposase